MTLDIDNLREQLKQLLNKQEINIYIGMDRVSERDKTNFTYPLLLESVRPKQILRFLKNSNKLWVDITNRRVEKFRVYYSGTIKNEREEVIEFKDVDNNFCVNAG